MWCRWCMLLLINMTLKKINILEYAFGEGGGGHQKAYAVYAFINVDNCERPLICYAIYTAVMYLMTLCLYCCPGKRVSRYLGDLHASGLIVGLNCRSPDQKHPVKINILLLLLLLQHGFLIAKSCLTIFFFLRNN